MEKPDSAQRQGLPIYLRIKELLLREIGAGKWLRGERLPTEAELAAQLSVAVGTLRKALAALERDGILERRQGSGTYVTQNIHQQAIYHFFRLEKANGQTGFPSAKVLSLHQDTHSWAAQNLHFPLDTVFWNIRRLRRLDKQAVAIEEILLPKSLAPHLDIKALPESLYMFYREHLSFWITQVADAVSVDHLPTWGAQRLGLAPAQACGLVERTAYDQHNRKVEFSLTWFNPDKARYLARWS